MLRFRLLLPTVLALITACAPPPLRPSEIEEPALRIVHDRFQEIVRDAHADPERSWHNGWFGNLLVNYFGEENLGLCYEWQELVYDEILPTVEEVGWDATGVMINVETRHEHHAVLVYDPAVVNVDDVLIIPEQTPAYVLDAWRRGRPDIYRVHDWLAVPSKVLVPAELETLPYIWPEVETVGDPAATMEQGRAIPEEALPEAHAAS